MPQLDSESAKWRPLFWPLFIVDYVLCLLLSLFSKASSSSEEMQSVVVGTATKTHGAPRRSPLATEKFIATYRGATTVYEMIQQAIAKYGTRVAMQHFEFVELKKLKETDRFPSKVFSQDLIQVTYKQLGENLQAFGFGLRSSIVGMEPQPSSASDNFDNAKGKFTLVIFEDTCKEWTTALQGALSQSMVVATCYATLGHDAVISAVQETAATAIFVNWKEVESFHKRAKEMPTLTTIIASTHEMPADATIWRPNSKAKIQVVSYDEVLQTGKENKQNVTETKPKPSDVAVIMYTSGSTGKPKGVVMKHSHLVAGIAGMVTNVHLRPGQETFVSYLPLAHILALQVENVLLSVGATLCYSDARQLSKVMPKFKPTIMAGVPKVWELLQAGVERQLEKAPAFLKVVFNILLDRKIEMLKNGMDTPISNLFFGVISTKVFGRKSIEFGVTGGGPMSANLQLFCRAVFNCPIIQGYALTETCVGGCFQSLDDQRSGIVGPPVPCVEVVLQSEPEFKDSGGFPYLHTDTKGSKGEPVLGRGEICLRGPSISMGYYKLPDKTKEDFDKEGFFHTGDIGQFTHDGAIQIVDRKKNLVKLKGGEYVAVEAMETAFTSSPYASAICVIANGDIDAPFAFVCTTNDALEKWARNDGNISFESVHELASMEKARKEVVKSFVAAGKEAGLGKLELRIKDVALLTDTQWLPGKGMTASMKLDRQKIFAMHDEELKELYKRNGVKA